MQGSRFRPSVDKVGDKNKSGGVRGGVSKVLARRRFVRAVQNIQLRSSISKGYEYSDDSDEEERPKRTKTSKETYLDKNICGKDDEEWSVFGGPTKKQREVHLKPSLEWHKERSRMAARQQRTKNLAAPIHGSREDVPLGPGAYDLNRMMAFPAAEFRAALSSREARALDRGKGARFSKAVVPSETEKLQRRAMELPSPGQYKLPDVAEEQRRRGGGKFNVSKSKTALEMIEHTAKQTPGPGEYTLPDMSEEQRRRGGGRFNEATSLRSKNSLEENSAGSSVPGPGAYSISPGLGDGANSGRGATVGRSERTSYLDDRLREASRLPSAADYDAAKSSDALTKPKGGGVKFSSTGHEDALKALLTSQGVSPGPGQYIQLTGADEALKGGRFNTSNAPSQTDVMCHAAAQMPGPGQYDFPRSQRAIRSRGVGTTFSGGADSLTDLDRLLLRSKDLPGPAQYFGDNPDGSSALDQRLAGGKFNLAKPLGPLDRQLLAAKQIPGPGQYNVVGCTRFGDAKQRY